MSPTKKILLLDGISKVPLGKTLFEAMQGNHDEVSYCDLLSLPQKFAYKIKRALAKLQQRKQQDLRYFYYPKTDPAAIKKVFETIRPEIVMVVGYFYRYIDREVLMNLKKQCHFHLVLFDTESANFLLNSEHLQYFLQYELTLYEQIFSFSQRMVNYFQQLGYANTLFFPYGANELPLLTLPKTQEVSFIATPEMRRLMVLEELAQLPLHIYGKKWQDYRKLISTILWQKITPKNIWGHELNQALQSSKIILNINNFTWHGIESGVNLRIFETLAARSFLLTEYSQELEKLFELGKEIETFKTIEELREKIIYYLAHDEEREAIAQRGHQRFLKDYTWAIRIRKLLLTF